MKKYLITVLFVAATAKSPLPRSQPRNGRSVNPSDRSPLIPQDQVLPSNIHYENSQLRKNYKLDEEDVRNFLALANKNTNKPLRKTKKYDDTYELKGITDLEKLKLDALINKYNENKKKVFDDVEDFDKYKVDELRNFQKFLEDNQLKFYNLKKKPKLEKLKLRNIKSTKLEKKSPYDVLFDSNGMLFLTQPKVNENRKINSLMSKVIEYNTELDKNKLLRHPATEVFDRDEVDEIKKIVNAIQNEDDSSKTYDFEELVV